MDDIQREYSARLASGGREIAFSSVQRLRPNGLGPFPGRYHLHGIPDCRSYAVSNAVEGVLFGGKGRGIHPWIGSGFFDGISARGKWFGALSSSHLRNLVWSSFKSARRYDSPSPLDETAACNEPPSRISAPHFSSFFFVLPPSFVAREIFPDALEWRGFDFEARNDKPNMESEGGKWERRRFVSATGSRGS